MTGDAASDPSPTADSNRARSRRTALAYAELVRLPNLFTAPPDVILGSALVVAAGHGVSPGVVAGLALASVALYAGGTTLNDAFDAPIDARERPDRPIPSGRIDRRVAFGVGVGLLALGIVLAAVAAGFAGGLVAGLVAIAIVLYDGVLKDTAVGFLTMGATRGLNVVLGTTAAGFAILEGPTSLVVVPLAIVLYIGAVTFMAARETEGDNRCAVIAAGLGALVAVGTVGWRLLSVSPDLVDAVVAVALASTFCWWVGRPLVAAYRDPVPETVGPAVGACVVGLVLLDGALAAATGALWGIVAAAFLLPARVLSGVFDVT